MVVTSGFEIVKSGKLERRWQNFISDRVHLTYNFPSTRTPWNPHVRHLEKVLNNLQYLGAIYFHNQRPSTTPACSKTAHVTIHWKWRWSQFQGIGSVTFGPEQQEQHIRYCGGLDQIERTCQEKLLCAKATNVVHQDCEDPIWSLTGISEGAVFSGCQYDNSLDMLNVHEFSWSYFLDTT